MEKICTARWKKADESRNYSTVSLTPVFYSSPQAAIKEQKEADAAAKAEKAEVEAKVEAAKAALKEASEKLQAAAENASAETKEFAQIGFKSLLAGWEEAKKTFNSERK